MVRQLRRFHSIMLTHVKKLGLIYHTSDLTDEQLYHRVTGVQKDGYSDTCWAIIRRANFNNYSKIVDDIKREEEQGIFTTFDKALKMGLDKLKSTFIELETA